MPPCGVPSSDDAAGHGTDKLQVVGTEEDVALELHEVVVELLNQKMTPQMLSTEENKQKLEMLIRAFFNRLHGYHVQYNIVSRETLLDAQKHPEKHKDLIVRVAGYSPPKPTSEKCACATVH